MNIWDFHLTGNISQNSAKYNHSRLEKARKAFLAHFMPSTILAHFMPSTILAHFMPSTIDFLSCIVYIILVIRLQILVKPAIEGGAKAPFLSCFLRSDCRYL